METHADIINAFGVDKFAEALGITVPHARVMRTRNSIPAEYFPQVTCAAQSAGIGPITFDLLFDTRQSKQPAE